MDCGGRAMAGSWWPLADVMFCFDVEATPEAVLKALITTDGIKDLCTSRADVPAEVGKLLKSECATAPPPFDLRLEQFDERTVVWRSVTFPRHWSARLCLGTSRRAAPAQPSAFDTQASPTTRQSESPTPGVRSWCD
jgi:hypothetical protein